MRLGFSFFPRGCKFAHRGVADRGIIQEHNPAIGYDLLYMIKAEHSLYDECFCSNPDCWAEVRGRGRFQANSATSGTKDREVFQQTSRTYFNCCRDPEHYRNYICIKHAASRTTVLLEKLTVVSWSKCSNFSQTRRINECSSVLPLGPLPTHMTSALIINISSRSILILPSHLCHVSQVACSL